MQHTSDEEWLLFLPQLPASPSSLRVLVWRPLGVAGVVGPQSGVWVLARRSEHERFLLDLAKELEHQGGTSSVFAASPLDPASATRMLAQAGADRDWEYAEFCERCAALLAELEKETDRQKFSFAELVENEEDLRKLRKCLAKVTARDCFGTSGAAAAQEAFARCRQHVAAYAQAAYTSEGSAPEDISQYQTTSRASSDPPAQPELDGASRNDS